MGMRYLVALDNLSVDLTLAQWAVLSCLARLVRDEDTDEFKAGSGAFPKRETICTITHASLGIVKRALRELKHKEVAPGIYLLHIDSGRGKPSSHYSINIPAEYLPEIKKPRKPRATKNKIIQGHFDHMEDKKNHGRHAIR